MLKIKEYISLRFDELINKHEGDYKCILTKVSKEVEQMFKTQCILKECANFRTYQSRGYSQNNFVIGYLDEENNLQMQSFVEIIENTTEFIEDYE